ncbi:methane monooxygenase/ammonia monooxygenase subunit B [Nitrosovibrio sp. Nv4]|uniref:methane monooxygenase/ammonia monooxygenase subunit B n=1 Tax=Nitrosovibrio sp. Nv4 TaxID=1945880 RepID=UPI004040C3C0
MATLAMTLGLDITPAAAHGERSQEPFLRMRTIQWYDMKWGPETTKVNDLASMSGKFHLAEDWPRALANRDAPLQRRQPKPGVRAPEHQTQRRATMISGPLEIGRDYAFEVKLKARIPGRHHMHAMVNIKDAGPIAGPAAWMNITGSWDDFTNPVKLLTGETIDTETFNFSNGIFWHARGWDLASSGLATTLPGPCSCRAAAYCWPTGMTCCSIRWTRRLPGSADTHLWPGLGRLPLHRNQASLHRAIQAGESKVQPLPVKPNPIAIKVTHANYDVPGRALRVTMMITNSGDSAYRIGEFTTAGVRFINKVA